MVDALRACKRAEKCTSWLNVHGTSLLSRRKQPEGALMVTRLEDFVPLPMCGAAKSKPHAAYLHTAYGSVRQTLTQKPKRRGEAMQMCDIGIRKCPEMSSCRSSSP